MLLLAVAAQATVTTTTIKPATTTLILGPSDPDSNPNASQQITTKDINLNLGDLPSSILLRSSLEELIDLALTMDTNFDRIFDVEIRPITLQDAAIDINQILFAGSDASPWIVGPHRQLQNLATLELVANSLGSTSIAKGSRFSSGAGFPLGLAAIVVLLLCTGLVSLAFMVLRQHT